MRNRKRNEIKSKVKCDKRITKSLRSLCCRYGA